MDLTSSVSRSSRVTQRTLSRPDVGTKSVSRGRPRDSDRYLLFSAVFGYTHTMTPSISFLLDEGYHALESLYASDPDRIWYEVELLLAFVMGEDRVWLVAHSDRLVDDAHARRFRALIQRRAGHEPIAYLVGSAEFFGRQFHVDPRVLIPRPETEELAAHAIKKIKDAIEQPLVWDVGTGSGAIAVTVSAECPGISVLASDIDPKALAVAKTNAKNLKAPVSFYQDNLLGPTIKRALTKKRFRPPLLIVANLPYLPVSDKNKLMPDVVKFEPARALFVPGDGSGLVMKLVEQLAAFQKKDKRPLTVLAEIDPPQSRHLQKFAKKLFPSAAISVLKDSCGRNRILEIESTIKETKKEDDRLQPVGKKRSKKTSKKTRTKKPTRRPSARSSRSRRTARRS